MYQIVIDTNVLVSALRSRRGYAFKLIEAFGDMRWQANVSVPLVLEYEQVIQRERAKLGLTPSQARSLLGYVVSVANHRIVYFSWRPLSHDPGDDLILELAIACAADWIVTYNQKNFREAWRFGIGVTTPRDFLRLIGEAV